MSDYLLLFLIVFGVNLMPAFGPPTWSVLVLFGLNNDLRVAPMVFIGAIAAAAGRYLLALAFRRIPARLSSKSRTNLGDARRALEQRRYGTAIALGVFLFSPLPSAQLFEAAGLMRIRLLPFTLVFFAGRLASYALYVFAAVEIRESSLGDSFSQVLKSPGGIVLQVVLLALLVAMTRIDWSRFLKS